MLLSALEIRSSFALGLVLESIYGTDSEVVQDVMLDVQASAQSLGFDDYSKGANCVSAFFSDSPTLVSQWRIGYETAEALSEEAPS